MQCEEGYTLVKADKRRFDDDPEDNMICQKIKGFKYTPGEYEEGFKGCRVTHTKQVWDDAAFAKLSAKDQANYHVGKLECKFCKPGYKQLNKENNFCKWLFLENWTEDELILLAERKNSVKIDENEVNTLLATGYQVDRQVDNDYPLHVKWDKFHKPTNFPCKGEWTWKDIKNDGFYTWVCSFKENGVTKERPFDTRHIIEDCVNAKQGRGSAKYKDLAESCQYAYKHLEYKLKDCLVEKSLQCTDKKVRNKAACIEQCRVNED